MGLCLLRLNQERDGFVLDGELANRIADDDQQLETLKFGAGFGITTDLQVGPDGALYVTSYSNGTIYRITPMPGDANRDGEVTIADLGILAGNWQQIDRSWMQGDFNGDGVVNIADLGILAANWQAGVEGRIAIGFAEALALFDSLDGVVIPEPGGHRRDRTGSACGPQAPAAMNGGDRTIASAIRSARCPGWIPSSVLPGRLPLPGVEAPRETTRCRPLGHSGGSAPAGSRR
jgi:hypothetical protein